MEVDSLAAKEDNKPRRTGQKFAGDAEGTREKGSCRCECR